ncbi:MAG: DUF1653 domain-containing protein [Firmicutes bacterium]|nr:DUF1653 domain-containing protein [Bacillota bacterium]
MLMRKVKIKGYYKHFKGKIYMVEDIAKDCETLEDVVVYRALYDNKQLWVRKYNDFISEVDHNKYPDVKQKYRFEELRKEDIYDRY